jgi:hypothetical protein
MTDHKLCEVLHLSDSVERDLDRISRFSSDLYITGELCKNVSGFNLKCSDFNKHAMAVFSMKPLTFVKDHYFPLNEYLGTDNTPHLFPNGLNVFIQKGLAKSVQKENDLICIELDLANPGEPKPLLLANFK